MPATASSQRATRTVPAALSIDDLAAWANCRSTFRGIEQTMTMTMTISEPIVQATMWYLDHVYNASHSGPKASINRLKDLMTSDRNRAACLMSWYLKRKAMEEATEVIKALYGTVEAARLWYNLITKVLLEYGFVPNKYERCVLNKTTTTGLILTVVLYVDDLLVTCKSEQAIVQLKEYLETKFPEVSYHCGDIIEYVGMTIDFASRPGAAVVTMKQITQDIIDTSEVLRN